MRISTVYVQNFRKLLQCRIDFSKEITLFVGANNSGKTSAMDVLGKFLAKRSFLFNDFTISNRSKINELGDKWSVEGCEMPENVMAWDDVLPKVDLWLDVSPKEVYYVSNIIPTLKWRGGKIGLRLIYQPKDITKLFVDYKNEYSMARNTKASRKASGGLTVNLFPKNLCDFLERKLNSYFSVKAYILDPSLSESEPPQPTSFDMECLTDNPLKGIIRVDMIDAQRGLSDPDSSDGGEKVKRQLSTQMRGYYDKHLDPEKEPSPEDLDMLEVTETARTVFDKNLAKKFGPAISELEGLGYPGVADPKIIVMAKVIAGETLKHESAVQYALSQSDKELMLPEKYNGLGYQNLISMVFDLMGFRDGWMRVGKARQAEEADETTIEPLHLVLVEEPEAHLHVQVQQVFIRKAYSVLRNHPLLKENAKFTTQLVVSTHSSHIAREADFANLRYFKRLSETTECSIATAKVINLSNVFGKEDETDKFVTRYLQTTHCDLFFADAAILVEGTAESMLVPHFIRNKFPELHQRYISILSISGRHSHRLNPLIAALCLPTLVIADIDPAEKIGNHKAACPERGKELISGNYAITSWIINEKNLDKLYDMPAEKKIVTNGNLYSYSIRIAYQTPVIINYDGEDIETLPGTFEDCIVYTNYELFKTIQTSDTGSRIKRVKTVIDSTKSADDLKTEIYQLLREGGSEIKAEFALDLIFAIDPRDLTIPAYIYEGLEWLQNLLKPKESCAKDVLQ